MLMEDGAGASAPAGRSAPNASALDEPTTTTRELECALNDVEVRERGEAMATASQEAERLRAKRRTLNAAIRAHVDRMTTLAQAIDARREVREVPCTWCPEYAQRAWILRRDDLGDVIDQRPMTSADLQIPLPGLTEDEPPRPTKPLKAPKRKRANT